MGLLPAGLVIDIATLVADNPPPGVWFVQPSDPDFVAEFRETYGQHRMIVIDRRERYMQDRRGQASVVWLAPIVQFRGESRARIEELWSQFNAKEQKLLLEQSGSAGRVIPVPIARTTIYRMEDVDKAAWPGERLTSGPLAGGTQEHRWGVTG